ncbi:MAG: hypothetical protein DYG98_14755 [Haliscomenobacteraceae bacterium CHB4]|nr:hypothetical protein [Haliscomenobacteraceae bacterium CHB4]
MFSRQESWHRFVNPETMKKIVRFHWEWKLFTFQLFMGRLVRAVFLCLTLFVFGKIRHPRFSIRLVNKSLMFFSKEQLPLFLPSVFVRRKSFPPPF